MRQEILPASRVTQDLDRGLIIVNVIHGSHDERITIDATRQCVKSYSLKNTFRSIDIKLK